MKKYTEKSNYAQNNLNNSEYISKINNLINKLNASSNKLESIEKTFLINNGYELLNLDDVKLLIPINWSFQHLYHKLQNMPSPDDRYDKTYALNYFVHVDDLSSARNSKEYQDVVKKREDLIEQINDIYADFWHQEVKEKSDTEEESIIYMLAGLNKNIDSNTLNSITGIDKDKCRLYNLNKNNVVYKNDKE